MKLFLIMLLWTNLSEIVVLYKSFVATKDDVIIGLERDNAKLKNTIEDLRGELRASTTYAKPIAKGYIVNVGNLTQGTLGYPF